MIGSLIPFPGKAQTLSVEAGYSAAAAVLGVPMAERLLRALDLHLEDSAQLLAVSELLRQLVEVEPARAREEAEFFYRFLETPLRSIGLFDERDYYLGEFAYIAGGACRILTRREEARHWFDL